MNQPQHTQITIRIAMFFFVCFMFVFYTACGKPIPTENQDSNIEKTFSEKTPTKQEPSNQHESSVEPNTTQEVPEPAKEKVLPRKEHSSIHEKIVSQETNTSDASISEVIPEIVSRKEEGASSPELKPEVPQTTEQVQEAPKPAKTALSACSTPIVAAKLFPPRGQNFLQVLFHPKKDLLATRTEKGIAIYRVSDRKQLHFLLRANINIDWYPVGMKFSPDGKYLAYFYALKDQSTRNKTVILEMWSVQNGTRLFQISNKNSEHAVWKQIFFSQDSTLFAMAPAKNYVEVRDITTGKITTSTGVRYASGYQVNHIIFQANNIPINRYEAEHAVAYTKNRKTHVISKHFVSNLQTGGKQVAVTFGGLSTKKLFFSSTTSLDGHVNKLSFGPNEKLLVQGIAGKFSGFTCWDITTQKVLVSKETGGSFPQGMLFTPNGKKLFYFTSNKPLRILDIQTRREHQLDPKVGRIETRDISLNQLGNILAENQTTEIKLWMCP